MTVLIKMTSFFDLACVVVLDHELQVDNFSLVLDCSHLFIEYVEAVQPLFLQTDKSFSLFAVPFALFLLHLDFLLPVLVQKVDQF